MPDQLTIQTLNEQVAKTCRVQMSDECNDNVVKYLLNLFKEWEEVNISKAIREVCIEMEYSKFQIEHILKRRGLNKEYFEKCLLREPENETETANETNSAGSLIGLIGEMVSFFEKLSKAKKEKALVLLHNRNDSVRSFHQIYGGRSNDYSSLNNSLCEIFKVKEMKFISSSVIELEPMKEFLSANPCPKPKEAPIWNGITDKALVDRLKEIYGAPTKLPGLATEILKDNGDSYKPPRFQMNVNSAGLSMISEHYLKMRKHPKKGYSFDSALLMPWQLKQQWNSQSDFLGWVVKLGITKDFSKSPRPSTDAGNKLDDFAEIYEKGLHTDKAIMDNYLNHGIRPPRLIDEKYRLWEYDKPKNLMEFAGIRKGEIEIDNRYLASEKFEYLHGEEWLSRLYMFAKNMQGFRSGAGANDGPGIFEQMQGFFEFAPPIILSKVKDMWKNYNKFFPKG